MEWCKSQSGHDVVILDNGNYISFGKGDNIKWIHLCYSDHSGVKCGQMLPVTLNKVKREYSTAIGGKNLTKLRGLIQCRLDGDTLSRDKFYEVGEAINIEERQKEKKPKKRK